VVAARTVDSVVFFNEVPAALPGLPPDWRISIRKLVTWRRINSTNGTCFVIGHPPCKIGGTGFSSIVCVRSTT
jgi:hypothetical protein